MIGTHVSLTYFSELRSAMEESNSDTLEHIYETESNMASGIPVSDLPAVTCDSSESIDVFLHHPLHFHGYYQHPSLCGRDSKPTHTSPDLTKSTPVPVMLVKNNRSNANEQGQASENFVSQSEVPMSSETTMSISGIQPTDKAGDIPTSPQNLSVCDSLSAISTTVLNQPVYNAVDDISAMSAISPVCEKVNTDSNVSSILPASNRVDTASNRILCPAVVEKVNSGPSAPPSSFNSRYAFCACCRVPLLKPYTCVESIPLYFFCTACYDTIQQVTRRERNPVNKRRRNKTDNHASKQPVKRGGVTDQLNKDLHTKNNNQSAFNQPQSPDFPNQSLSVPSVLCVNNEMNTEGVEPLNLNIQIDKCNSNTRDTIANKIYNIFNLSQHLDSSATCKSVTAPTVTNEMYNEIETETIGSGTLAYTLDHRQRVADPYTIADSAVHDNADLCDLVKNVKEEPPDMVTKQPIHVQSCDLTSPQGKDRGQPRKKEKQPKGSYPCLECHQKFDMRVQLVRHNFIHSDTFRCTECGERFLSSGRLFRHAKKHIKSIKLSGKKLSKDIESSSNSNTMKQCPSKNIVSSNNNDDINNENTPFFCHWCKKPGGPVCDDEQCWHRRRTCLTCGLRFPTLKRLADHRATHVKLEDNCTHTVDAASRIDSHDLLSTILECNDISLSDYDVSDFLNDFNVKLE